MFCLFGLQCEKGVNRIQRLKKENKALYNYCLKDLGLKDVLNYMNLPY